MGPSFSLWLYRLRAWARAKPRAQALGETADTFRPARPSGPLIWVHSGTDATATQSHELIRVADENNPDLEFLITGHTAGAAPDDAPPMIQQDTPDDTPAMARLFLDHWRPDACIFFASALCPALITEAYSRKIPLFLIGDNPLEAGLADAGLRSSLAQALLQRFRHVFAVSSELAAHFGRHGAPDRKVTLIGPLSQGSTALPCDDAALRNLAHMIAGRPTWLAADVAQSEDDLIVSAHARTARLSHRLLLILEPDLPERGPELAASLRAADWHVALRSDDDPIEDDTQILIADRSGELGLWFRLAPVSVMGRTFHVADGPDPFLPAELGSAVVHGPRTNAHAAHYARLTAAKAACAVEDTKSLSKTLTRLLSPENSAAMAHNGWDVSTAGAVATETVVRHLLATLGNPEAA